MLFSPVFIATDPRPLASFPNVLPVCPDSPYDFAASLSLFPSLSRRSRSVSLRTPKSRRINTYKSLSKQRTLTLFRTIDLQKTGGEGWLLLTRFPMRTGLDSDDEVAVQGHVAVGHARRVEGKTGIAVAVEEDEAAGGVRALAKKVNRFARREIGGGEVA